MAVNSETEINLKTLQRVDSNIVEIIDNASQVAIYRYEKKLNKWEGTEIEGTLFLYKRSLYPFHGFIIVNRMSTTNFVEAITSDMEFVQHEPYFLYKKSCGEIIGSWFYEKRDFRRITNKIQSIVLKQITPPKRHRCSSDSDSQLKKDVDAVQDIMSMLSKAHTDYAKAETNVPISEQNIQEDFNDMSFLTDKKIISKSVNTCKDKSKSLCMRSTSEKINPVSPRRRFLSAGSYDSTSRIPLSTNKIINELVHSSNEAAVQHSKLETLENMENISTPQILPALFSPCDFASSAASRLSNIKHSCESVQMPFKSSVFNPVIPNGAQNTLGSKLNLKNKSSNKVEYEMHLSDLKETLLSHVQSDSDILVKIHEAYIASLQSVFAQKKC